jgi:hypothetical protein
MNGAMPVWIHLSLREFTHSSLLDIGSMDGIGTHPAASPTQAFFFTGSRLLWI